MKSNNQGFTIIETLISILLLAIILAGGMALFHNSDKWMGLVSHRKFANEMASAKLEELKTESYGGLSSSSDTIVVGLPYTRTWTVNPIDDSPSGGTDYQQVTIDVTWSEANSSETKRISLTTYIAP